MATGLRWLREHNEHHKIVPCWIKVSICDKKVNASLGCNRWKGSLWQQILWFSTERANCKILFECKMCWSTLSLRGSSQPLGVSRAGRSHASAGRSRDFQLLDSMLRVILFSVNDYRVSFRGFGYWGQRNLCSERTTSGLVEDEMFAWSVVAA